MGGGARRATRPYPHRRRGRVLRIDFGEPEEDFEEIEWDEFFEIFDESELVFLYQEETSDGEVSRFSKFVKKE